MWFAIEISDFFHVDQIQNSGQPKKILQEISISQVNDLEFEIYNGQNSQESTNRDIFKFIAYDSHFYLFLDIFSDSNLSPLCINAILENKEVNINKFSISFYQDRETIIDHSHAFSWH